MNLCLDRSINIFISDTPTTSSWLIDQNEKFLRSTCVISSATFKQICSLQIYRPKLMGVSIEPLNTCKATHNNTKFSHTFF